MRTGKNIRWEEEAEVVILGYGGAGAVAAIVAHDAGAKVLIAEKQPGDTPTTTRHTPSTRMSAGGYFCPADAEGAALYLRGMLGIANETLDREREEMISVFARYLVEGTDWMKSIGVSVGDWNSVSPTLKAHLGPNPKIVGHRIFASDFPELPGSESSALFGRRVGLGLGDALSGWREYCRMHCLRAHRRHPCR